MRAALGLAAAVGAAALASSTAWASCCYTYQFYQIDDAHKIINISSTPNYALSSINNMQSIITLNEGLQLDPFTTQFWPDPNSGVVNCTRMYDNPAQIRFMCWQYAPQLTVAFRYLINVSTLNLDGALSSTPVRGVQLYTDQCDYSSVPCVVIPEKGVFNLSSQVSLGALGQMPLWAVVTAGVAILALSLCAAVLIHRYVFLKRQMRNTANAAGKEEASKASGKRSSVVALDMSASPVSPSRRGRSRQPAPKSPSGVIRGNNGEIEYTAHPVELSDEESSAEPSGRVNVGGGHYRNLSDVSVVYHARPQSHVRKPAAAPAPAANEASAPATSSLLHPVQHQRSRSSVRWSRTFDAQPALLEETEATSPSATSTRSRLQIAISTSPTTGAAMESSPASASLRLRSPTRASSRLAALSPQAPSLSYTDFASVSSPKKTRNQRSAPQSPRSPRSPSIRE